MCLDDGVEKCEDLDDGVDICEDLDVEKCEDEIMDEHKDDISLISPAGDTTNKLQRGTVIASLETAEPGETKNLSTLCVIPCFV